MIFKFISVYKIIKQKFANKLNEFIIAENIYIKKIIMTEKGSISIKISFLQDKKVVTKIKHVVMDVLILMC